MKKTLSASYIPGIDYRLSCARPAFKCGHLKRSAYEGFSYFYFFEGDLLRNLAPIIDLARR